MGDTVIISSETPSQSLQWVYSILTLAILVKLSYSQEKSNS